MTLALAAAWLAVLASALGVVVARHEARAVFRELQVLEHARDELDIEWSQLSIEQGMLADPATIERLARERLGMRSPAADAIVLVHGEGLRDTVIARGAEPPAGDPEQPTR